jgi:hypothetical protein
VNCDPILCFIIGRITVMHPTPTFFFNNWDGILQIFIT